MSSGGGERGERVGQAQAPSPSYSDPGFSFATIASTRRTREHQIWSRCSTKTRRLLTPRISRTLTRYAVFCCAVDACWSQLAVYHQRCCHGCARLHQHATGENTRSVIYGCAIAVTMNIDEGYRCPRLNIVNTPP